MPVLKLDRRRRVVEANSLAVTACNEADELIGLRWDDVSKKLPSLGLDPAPLPAAESGEVLVLLSDPRGGVPLDFHRARLATIGQLVASVVHEINNALSGIVGYSQLLLERATEPRLCADLTRIHEQALRATRVVKNILRFSRQSPAQRTAVALRELLLQCADMKRRDLRLKSITLDVDLPQSLPAVDGDEVLLFQVFINLLANAEQSIQSTRRSGRIRITARSRGGWILVRLQDDGPGVPVRYREHIFEPFFTTRPPGEGTGLGLPLCREIVQGHGGSIRLATPRGPGACFELRFPASRSRIREVPPARPRGARPRVHDCRIVLVEDDPSVRDWLSRVFHGNGNRICAFERGEDATLFLRTAPVDVILSDVHREGMNGIDLHTWIARHRRSLLKRILFLTGDTVSATVQDFFQRTRVPHLAKPVLEDDLLRAVHRVLHPASARSAGQRSR